MLGCLLLKCILDHKVFKVEGAAEKQKLYSILFVDRLEII